MSRNGYSLNGYINAVRRRSNKTILVEGKSDKGVVERISTQKDIGARGKFVIDVCDIVSDDALSGLGAKVKVEKIHSEYEENVPANDRLICLVDREWEGLWCEIEQKFTTWSTPTSSPTRFITSGHSIENYSFVSACVREYLRFAFAENVTEDIENKVDELFFSAVCLSVALSEEVRRMQVIGRFNGIIGPQFIDLSEEKFFLNTDIERNIQCRGITSADFAKRVNQRVEMHYDLGSSVQELRWFAHGHVGEYALWSAIAKIFESHGCAPNVTNDVAFGNKEMRSKFWSDWLSKQSREAREPIDELLETASNLNVSPE